MRLISKQVMQVVAESCSKFCIFTDDFTISSYDIYGLTHTEKI